jgi:hypothetical protein
MKDPKVAELVKELKSNIKKLNSINTKLYKQGVTYRLEDGYDEETSSKVVSINYLKQEVTYE